MRPSLRLLSLSGALLLPGVLMAGDLKVNAAGRLIIRSQVTLSGGAVTVGTGGTLELRSGTLTAGAATIESNGRLQGNGSVNGPLTLASGSTWAFEIGSLVPNAGYDQVAVSGVLTLGGTVDVKFKNGFQTSVTNGDTFTLATSGNPIVGSSQNVASGARIATSDAFGSFLGNYTGTNFSLSAFQNGVPTLNFAAASPDGPMSFALRDGVNVRTLFSRSRHVAAVFGADGRSRVRVGDAIPGLAGSAIAKLGVPSGDAVLATLKLDRAAGITAANDTVLLAGLIAGPIRIAAREGTDLPDQPGVSVKSFGTIDGQGATIFFSATQHGAATAGSNAALCAALANGTVRTLVREGQTVDGRTVATIGTLLGAAGTLAEGRWRAGDNEIGARLTFSDKTHALYTIPASASDPAQWLQWATSGDVLASPLDGATIARFGLPGFGAEGPAFLAGLEPGPGGVTPDDNTVLLRADAAGLTLLAREGAPAPGAGGARFKGFSDPVSGSRGRTAFAAQLNGVPRDTASGLWYAADGATTTLLARAGEAAPGGGAWASFQSLALPDGPESGPIFTAKLAINRAENISAGNNFGLWVVNGVGLLRRALITGQTLEVDGAIRTVKSFTALLPGAGSIGAAYGYDAAGHITVQATFTDRTSALLEISVP